MRLFVALDLDESVMGRLDELLGELRRELPEIRWARREGLHLTLRFLGEVDEARVPALCQALEGVAEATAPFRVEVEGLGTFGDRRRPKVVWAGVQERSGALEELQGRVERAAVEAGFETESRPFRAHLTLARLKRSHPGLGRALAPRAALKLGASRAGSMTLIQSRLSPEGARYTPVRSFAFGPGGEEAGP